MNEPMNEALDFDKMFGKAVAFTKVYQCFKTISTCFRTNYKKKFLLVERFDNFGV